MMVNFTCVFTGDIFPEQYGGVNFAEHQHIFANEVDPPAAPC